MVLSKAKQFGDVTVNKEDGMEKINLHYTEKVEEMSFRFKLNISLVILGEEEEQDMMDDGDDNMPD
jgi:hypothetical protein